MALPAPSDQDPDALEPRLEAVIARARRTGPEPAAPPAHGRMNPVAAGLFAALAGLVALVALALAYVAPGTMPLAAPIAVILGAVSLWGASRIDESRYRRHLEALGREKLELATTLERIAGSVEVSRFHCSALSCSAAT